MISIDQMRYFIAIVENGSLNKASQYLYISQPALTKQLAILEKSLQRSLLLRTPAGIKLTPSGRYFYERSNTIIKMLNETITGVSCFGGKDTIKIGGLANLITFFLIMKSSNYLSELKEIDFLTIAKEKLIMYKDPCPIRTKIREHCNLMMVTPNIVLELESTESLISYVEQDFGITILPKMVADSINSPLIAVREIKKFPIHRVISAVLKKEKVSSYLHFYCKLKFN